MIQPGILLSAGLLLVAGLLGGIVARLFKLPTLTGYLAAGILLGHHGLDLLPHATVDRVTGPVNDLAMALVLFVLGGRFHLEKVRELAKSTLTISAVEGTSTFLLVTLLTWPVLGNFPGAILLGVMAVAIAPATTVEVLREYKADGPTTDTLKLLTALSNIWAVLFFEIVLLFLFSFSGADTGAKEIVWDLAGAVLYGLVAGHALILLQNKARLESSSVPLLVILLLTIGLCKTTGVPQMLAMMVTGAVVVNRSRFFEPITQSMDAFAQPAFVAFFVLSGIHLDFGILSEFWIAAGLYILARVIGKVLGARLGMKMSGLKLPALAGKGSPPLGLGLLCQAGAAIMLANLAKSYDPELGDLLLNIILGAVVVFEIVGPLLVKHVVVAAGEVQVGSLLTHGTHRPEGVGLWGSLVRTFRGRKLNSNHGLHEIQVNQIMRHVPKSLAASANLDEVLRFANHSPFNHFPVLTADGKLLGVIALADLAHVAYDRRMASLVTAEDLAGLSVQEAALSSKASLEVAVEFFENFEGNTVAVTESHKDHTLVGMMERGEVLAVVRSFRKKEEANL